VALSETKWAANTHATLVFTIDTSP
jgi:hypothetical protein